MAQQMTLFGPPAAKPTADSSRLSRHISRDWRREIAPPQPQLDLVCEGFEDLFDWDEQAIARMREGLLISSIQDLCDNRTSEWVREEIWDWIHDPDDSQPFSFAACAWEWDERIDPDDLRKHIEYISRKSLESGESYLLLKDEKGLLDML